MTPPSLTTPTPSLTATPRFFGFTGKKNSGKDAAASALGDLGVRRIAFADALKVVCMDLYDLSYNQCFGSIAEKERFDDRWGMSAREILQRFGTEGARVAVHPETWIAALFRDVEAYEERGLVRHYDVTIRRWTWIAPPGPMRAIRRMWAIPDVRYQNEVDAIHAHGGFVFRITRPDASTGRFENHTSETSVDTLNVDGEIKNDGTLDEFKRAVRSLVFSPSR